MAQLSIAGAAKRDLRNRLQERGIPFSEIDRMYIDSYANINTFGIGKPKPLENEWGIVIGKSGEENGKEWPRHIDYRGHRVQIFYTGPNQQ